MQKRWGILPCALAAVALACGGGESDTAAKRRAMAESSLAGAPEDIRGRVSQGCNRWADLQGGCDPELLRQDILECWTDAALPHLRGAIERGMRQRARYRKVVMHHSLCVERHGWRFKPNTGGYF